MWINAGEIPDNNIDDDNNGFIDDVYGADVVGSIYDHDGDPQDEMVITSIIAAQGITASASSGWLRMHKSWRSKRLSIRVF